MPLMSSSMKSSLRPATTTAGRQRSSPPSTLCPCSATMLTIVALLTWWSYEAGVLWLFLLFLGLISTLLTLSSRKKDEDVDDDGEDLTDMESFELVFRR